MLVHYIELLLEDNPDFVVFKTDIKNEFNSLDRSCILEEVSKSFPDVFGRFDQMYSERNCLTFLNDTTSAFVSSEEGVHQGGSLVPNAIFISIATYSIHNSGQISNHHCPGIS